MSDGKSGRGSGKRLYSRLGLSLGNAIRLSGGPDGDSPGSYLSIYSLVLYFWGWGEDGVKFV